MRNYISRRVQIKMLNNIMTQKNLLELIESKQYVNELLFEFYNNEYGSGTSDCNTPALRKYVAKCLRDLRKEHMYQFITLSPDYLHRNLMYSEENVEKLTEFCEKWFSPKRYAEYHWIIEYGKVDEGHLHIHCLVRMKHKKQGKNHARELKEFWKRCFPGNPLIGKDYLSKNCSGKFYFDKLDYFNNENKGSHENFMDLDLQGHWVEDGVDKG